MGVGGVIPAAAAFAGAVEDALEPFGACARAHPLDPPAVLAMIEGTPGTDNQLPKEAQAAYSPDYSAQA